jgi:hypothetical protein
MLSGSAKRVTRAFLGRGCAEQRDRGNDREKGGPYVNAFLLTRKPQPV